jgi:hypothetical protein
MRKLLPELLSLLAVVTVACAGQTTAPTSPNNALPSTSGLSAKAAANISVTTTISDVDTNIIAADISSDGHGAYSDNVAGVTSILTANGYNNIKYGDWQFDTSNSATRGVNKSLDPDDAVQPGDPHFLVVANPPFWGTRTSKDKMEVKCTNLGKSMLTMAAGATITCGLINELKPAGLDYGLHPAHSFNGFPETTDIQITCSAADAGGCKDWSLDPIGLGRAVARLNHRPSKNTQVTDGDFYLRFHIHVTRP